VDRVTVIITNATIRPGTVWRKDTLGTSATYEVLRVQDELVEVIVREAPGLERGTIVKLTCASLRAMRQL
jgi:hypothetical protein